MDESPVESLHQSARALLREGRTQAAIEVLLRIVNSYANEPRSRLMLAMIAHQAGQLQIAMDWLNKTLAIDPGLAEPWYLAGIIYQQQNQLPSAIDAYRHFLARKPNDSKALNNLGRALLDVGATAEGIALLKRAIAVAPQHAGAYNNLGDALREQGELVGARQQYQQAIAVDPNCAEAHGNLGVLLVQQGQQAEGAASMQRAIAINPRMFNPHFNLARVHQDSGRFEEAMQQCRIAIDLRPNSAEAHNLLGNLLGQAGQVPECIFEQKRAVQLKPDFASAHSNLLLTMQYAADSTPADLFTAHQQWAAQHARPIQNAVYRNDRNIKRRLRIGYVSPNFNAHSVAYFFEPVLAAHDKTIIEIFCYSDLARGDAITVRIRNLSEHWREIAGKTDSEVKAMIEADQVDILIDLAGHTASNRLPLFAMRPAPVQMSWIGYPATTGMSAMDYRITDPIADPAGSEQFHTEKLLRVEGGCWAYQAPVSPAIEPIPSLSKGYVTFGSFNNLPKVTPTVIATWATILKKVPTGRLLMKSAGLGAKLAREFVRGEFAKTGITADRIELLSWTPTTEDHFRLYNRIDIALDTFPYNGTTTTCESLWMGVPVVTFAGQSHVSRLGAALLTHAGLTQWIATDVQGYIDLAWRMSVEPGYLSQQRHGLRDQLKRSPLCDAVRSAARSKKFTTRRGQRLRRGRPLKKKWAAARCLFQASTMTKFVAVSQIEPLEGRVLLSSYFVDPSVGNDANTGRSWHTPWQNLSAVSSHSFKRGDKVYLTGTFSGESLVIGSNGTGISINSYAVNAAGTSAKRGVPNAVVLSNIPATGIDISTSNITIQNLIITADPSSLNNGEYNNGIYFENHRSVALSHETINNVTVSGFSYAGLCMRGWNTSIADSAGFSNVLIENSSFHDNEVSGIFVGTGDTSGNEFVPDFPSTFYANSKLEINNCQAFNNAGFNPSLTGSYDGTDVNNGNFADGGIFISSVNNATVQKCMAWNNCFAADGGVGIWTFDSSRVNFQSDQSFDNKTAGDVDGDGFDFDHGTINSTMQRDYSHGNAGIGFFLTTFGGSSNNNNDTIKFCISDDDGQRSGAGVGVLSITNTPILGANIYNNTILATGGNAGISLSGDATSADSVNILNNVFITDSTSPIVVNSAPSPSMVFGGNDYWTLNSPSVANVTWGGSSFTTLSQWTTSDAAIGERNVDPQLGSETVSDLPIAEVGNLMLGSGSPLRKGAISLAAHHIVGVGRLNFFKRPIQRQAVGAG